MGMELSDRVSKVQASVTLEITAKAKKMRAEGRDVISFGAGEPDFNTPDIVKQAAIDAINADFTRYTPASGIPELKKAVSEKLLNDNNVVYAPEEISVCTGAKHALYNCLQVLCNKGDEVLIPAPFWVSYPDMAYLAEAVPVIIPSNESTQFKITPDLLADHMSPRSKILIINSPSNPTGMVYSRQELEAIAAFACEKDLVIISDEIYEKLIYGQEHVCIASLSDEVKKRTITVNGLSKSHCMTGWRLGYTAAPGHVAKAINNLLSQSTSNATSITQKAALAAMRVPQNVLDRMTQEFQKRRDHIVARLNDIPGISCLKPDGAFYVFPNIKGLGRGGSMAVANHLLEDVNVAVVPGVAFGADDNLRLSYACSMEDITKGLDRIEQWAQVKQNT